MICKNCGKEISESSKFCGVLYNDIKYIEYVTDKVLKITCEIYGKDVI